MKTYVLAVFLTLATAAVVAPPACAQPAEEQEDARALFLRGQAAYTQGDYETAIALWERAYALDPRPALQYNLAQAHGRLGELQKEAEALERFIATAPPESTTLPAARARQAALRERLARTGIEVAGAPEGALVLVDGVERGRTPLPEPIRVPGGEHTITLRAPGYADFQTGLSVDAGDVERVTVVMVSRASPREPERQGGVSPAAWALLGVGGAALVTGTALGMLALGESDGAARGSAEADRARGLARGADVSFALGGAAVVTGLVVALVGGKGRRDDAYAEARLRVAPLASRSRAGLFLEGSF